MYFIAIILLHIPMVQNKIGLYVSELVSNKLGTTMTIGRIDLGFFNRLIADDIYLNDKSNEQLLKVSRLSINIDLEMLAQGKISISSIQLFGMQANAYKIKASNQYNFQFILDSLKSKDKSKKSPLDLQINSLIIRNGAISFRQQEEHLHQVSTFQSKDIDLNKISAHIVLNKLTNDSISLNVKRLSFAERSGLNVSLLTFKLTAGKKDACLADFALQMPNSKISVNKISASYTNDNGKIVLASVQYNGKIEANSISPSDLSFLKTSLANFNKPISLNVDFNGTYSGLRVKKLAIASSDDLKFVAEGAINLISGKIRWNVNTNRLFLTSQFADNVCKVLNISYPKFLADNENFYVDFTGSAGGYGKDASLRGLLKTSAGNANIALGKHDKFITASLKTTDFDLKAVTGNENLGLLSANVDVKGNLQNTLFVDGNIDNICYKSEVYSNIKIDTKISSDFISGNVSIDDSRGKIKISGSAEKLKQTPTANLNIDIQNLYPATLKILKNKPDLCASMNIEANLKGHNINDVVGNVNVGNIVLQTKDETLTPNDIHINSNFQGKTHSLSFNSDFCKLDINGQFKYTSLAESIKNIIAKHIYTLPGKTLKYVKQNDNNFSINASVTDTKLLNKLTELNVILNEPLVISGTLKDNDENIDLHLSAPSFSYNDSEYKNASFIAQTRNDSLLTLVSVKKVMGNGSICSYALNAGANNNSLSTIFKLNDNEKQPIQGTLKAKTNFYKDDNGRSIARIMVLPSVINIGDTIWNVHQSSIEYADKDLSVEDFCISHDNQKLSINGRATKHMDDSLNIALKDIDISYILNLVNFHAVEFSGMASGTAVVGGLFADQPKAYTNLSVSDFRFENGRLGTLQANATFNNALNQIDIEAEANDTTDRRTIINGYVSPKRSDICLDITAQNTRVEFMQSFCSSFLENVYGSANGSIRLYGPLSGINLTGNIVANGGFKVTSLNTNYTFDNAHVKFEPNSITMTKDTIRDRNGNIGIVSAHLGHRNLSKLTYDLDIDVDNFLSYDTHTFKDNNFYGTAFVTGNCKINGRSGELNITVDGTPQKGSILVYDVASPDAIVENDFLHWTSHEKSKDSLCTENADKDKSPIELASDIKMNFLINCTKDATLKLLMDNVSGDYITLNGNGVLKANYFNKGAFDIFGNYNIETGHYKLTVQNFIKRDFLFRQGGSINFGGDPYSAALNLNAVYTQASVSLADLNMGKSFTNNNTRVDCIMNITGTPSAPHVEFSLNVPSISSDAQQMIYSLMNSEEELNQQVLYLLAVGRFMPQGKNNAGVDGSYQNQTSLAMQSILSGTIMQQVNDVIGNLTSNSNWNFGANISTGTEGLNNAEYEGLLSGSLLSGRLLVDGQFGYRDKANATTSFIGDFDLRYLLYPNGNLAINVYNKTNDRYFTRNSLTTQGIGLLLKKDFTTLSDLFGIKSKKNVLPLNRKKRKKTSEKSKQQ